MQTEAHCEHERSRHRSRHIGTVAVAFIDQGYPAELALEYAATAVDALLADGVVFTGSRTHESGF